MVAFTIGLSISLAHRRVKQIGFHACPTKACNINYFEQSYLVG